MEIKEKLLARRQSEFSEESPRGTRALSIKCGLYTPRKHANPYHLVKALVVSPRPRGFKGSRATAALPAHYCAARAVIYARNRHGCLDFTERERARARSAYESVIPPLKAKPRSDELTYCWPVNKDRRVPVISASLFQTPIRPDRFDPRALVIELFHSFVRRCTGTSVNPFDSHVFLRNTMRLLVSFNPSHSRSCSCDISQIDALRTV